MTASAGICSGWCCRSRIKLLSSHSLIAKEIVRSHTGQYLKTNLERKKTPGKDKTPNSMYNSVFVPYSSELLCRLVQLLPREDDIDRKEKGQGREKPGEINKINKIKGRKEGRKERRNNKKGNMCNTNTVDVL